MLTTETVEKVSHLARLKLTEHELRAFSEQLSAVLANFEQISQVDTNGVAPLVTPTDMAVHLRVDVVEATDGEKMLSNAPDKSGRLFKVPPVV
ncbi:MAG: Asp-tRNA(Asn)/Glu-tRNA(Gln) amidotransferase subunit GatC [Bdellovibrionota bacterium]